MLHNYFPYKEMEHKEILLYGFHFSFAIVFSLSSIADYFLDSSISLFIDLSATLLVLLSYYFLHYKKKELTAKIIITILTIVPLFSLIYVNHSDNFDVVYVVLLPLVSFYLYTLKQAVIINIIIYILIGSLFYYIYLIDPTDMIMHNTFALLNIFLATILIMFFGLFYHLGIESSLRKLRESNKQKDILLKEVHHRVKNNLNVTASMLGLQAFSESDEVKPHLYKSKSRIEAIATVHEMLYKHNNFEEINFYEYVSRLDHLLLGMFEVKTKHTLVIDVDKDIHLSLDTMIQFGLIINEMMINTIKHAYNEDSIKVDISLKKDDNYFIFTYKDNGQKIINIQNLTSKNGLGSKLIDLSLKQINAKVKKYYNSGLCYEVRFKDA